jgi:hypothetical protein
MARPIFHLLGRLAGAAFPFVVAVSCNGSASHHDAEMATMPECMVDGDCATLTAAAVCRKGRCVANAGQNAEPPDAGDGPLPSCIWPPDLEKGVATRTTCAPARAYVSCTLSGGVTEHCLSDHATSCPNVPSFDPCKDQCRPEEYAVACGGVGPGPIPDPPAGCRAIPPNPAGYIFYCCPCS